MGRFDHSWTRRWPGSASAPAPDLPRELGLSALYVLRADQAATVAHVSESISEILGYEPSDLLGKTSYLAFHPDEIPLLREVHYRAVFGEKAGCILYLRLLHQGGFYVDCAVTYATVYDLSVGIITRAVNGPNIIPATAREVVEARGGSDVRLRRWTTTGEASPHASPLPSERPGEGFWERTAPLVRSFYLLDRFTERARVMFVSNNLIVDGSKLKDQSFYSIIRPSDRARVREWIEATKTWTPILFDNERTGGHGYLIFDVLQTPDYVDTETDDAIPGDFVSVEGIFTASSDGIACVISPEPRARSSRGESSRGSRGESRSSRAPSSRGPSAYPAPGYAREGSEWLAESGAYERGPDRYSEHGFEPHERGGRGHSETHERERT